MEMALLSVSIVWKFRGERGRSERQEWVSRGHVPTVLLASAPLVSTTRGRIKKKTARIESSVTPVPTPEEISHCDRQAATAGAPLVLALFTILIMLCAVHTYIGGGEWGKVDHLSGGEFHQFTRFFKIVLRTILNLGKRWKRWLQILDKLLF